MWIFCNEFRVVTKREFNIGCQLSVSDELSRGYQLKEFEFSGA